MINRIVIFVNEAKLYARRYIIIGDILKRMNVDETTGEVELTTVFLNDSKKDIL